MTTQEAQLRCVWPADAQLGESPLWLPAQQCLYWVDIPQGRLLRYCAKTGARGGWELPFPISSVVPCSDGGLILAAPDAIYQFDVVQGRFCYLCVLEMDRPGNRANDGICHPDGSFWFGTMDAAEVRQTGAFYRLSGDGVCIRLVDRFAITNGPAFSPDGRFAYLVDTLNRRILRAETESVPSLKLTPFAALTEDEGYPDGLAVDEDGGIWCAHWGAGRVTRFDAQGGVSRVFELPVSNVTKCAFGGARLDTLYITTARKGLDRRQLEAQPLAGGLFEMQVKYRGLAPVAFQTAMTASDRGATARPYVGAVK